MKTGLNLNSEVRRAIARTRRESILVGRVTPCAPRLQLEKTFFHSALLYVLRASAFFPGKFCL